MKVAKPSPAMVVACLALILSLAGTAIAVQSNSIGAKELGTVKFRAKSEPVPMESRGVAVAKCKSGEQLLGGGASFPGGDPEDLPSVEQSDRKGDSKWRAVANNDDSTVEVTLRVTAICLKE